MPWSRSMPPPSPKGWWGEPNRYYRGRLLRHADTRFQMRPYGDGDADWESSNTTRVFPPPLGLVQRLIGAAPQIPLVIGVAGKTDDPQTHVEMIT